MTKCFGVEYEGLFHRFTLSDADGGDKDQFPSFFDWLEETPAIRLSYVDVEANNGGYSYIVGKGDWTGDELRRFVEHESCSYEGQCMYMDNSERRPE